jgi:thioredoxin reductase (NADPH)
MSPELLIVGAGPAGVSAALWARALSLDVLLLESAPAPGGQLHAVHFHPPDLPGIESGAGPDIAASYARQLARQQVPVRSEVVATALEPAGPEGAPAVRLSTGERVQARSVLIATGVRRRRLEVPGERELEGRGVSYSATRDREWLMGRRVAVVGGGDAAFENSLLLTAAGCQVVLLVRGPARARPDFRRRVAEDPRIELHEGVRVTHVLGESAVTGLSVAAAGEEEESGVVECEAVVVKIGVRPNTEWCCDVLAHDPEGFLRIDERFATSVPMVFAAGDCTRPALPSIPVALAHGAQAAAVIRAALHGH